MTAGLVRGVLWSVIAAGALLALVLVAAVPTLLGWLALDWTLRGAL